MKKLLLILICLFVSFEVKSDKTVLIHEWVLIKKTDKKGNILKDTYLDIKNIKYESGFVYYWVLEDLKNPSMGFNSVIINHKGDCNEMIDTQLSFTFNKGKMGKEPFHKIIEEDKFVSLPIDSKGFVMLKRVCYLGKNMINLETLNN